MQGNTFPFCHVKGGVEEMIKVERGSMYEEV